MDSAKPEQHNASTGEPFQSAQSTSQLSLSDWQDVSMQEQEENWSFSQKQEQTDNQPQELQNNLSQEHCSASQTELLEQKEQPEQNQFQPLEKSEPQVQDQKQHSSLESQEEHLHRMHSSDFLHDAQATETQQAQHMQHGQESNMHQNPQTLQNLPSSQQQQHQQQHQQSPILSQPPQQQVTSTLPLQEQCVQQNRYQQNVSHVSPTHTQQNPYQHLQTKPQEEQQQDSSQRHLLSQQETIQHASQQLYSTAQTQHPYSQHKSYQQSQQQSPHSLKQLPPVQPQLHHSQQQQQQQQLHHPSQTQPQYQQLYQQQQQQQALPRPQPLHHLSQSQQQQQISQQQTQQQLSQSHLQHPHQHQRQSQLQQMTPQASPQAATGQISNTTRRLNFPTHHSISFGSLIPIILPHIAKDQAHQLQGLYVKLRKNEVSKEDFLRATRSIVGDQILVNAVRQMQMKQHAESQASPSSQHPMQQQQSHFQQSASQQNLHSLPSNESMQSQHMSHFNIPHQTQQTTGSYYQSHSQSTTVHATSDNNSPMNLHHLKHEVDRTVATNQLPNQQQPLQSGQSPGTMYGRSHGGYSTHSFPVSAGMPQSNVMKTSIVDPQMRATMNSAMPPQGIASQIANTRVPSKYEASKLPKKLDDDKLMALQTAMPGSAPAVLKQEINADNAEQQHKIHVLQSNTDNVFAGKSVLDQGQPFSQTKADIMDNQYMNCSNPLNQVPGSARPHTEHSMQVTSISPSLPVASQIKTSTKKSLIGQKKPLEIAGVSTQNQSKKQKTSASYPDQSIDQLNDVTAVSGVNLREEEEQLFAGPKEESHATEAIRRVAQEEEDRMFLEKGPLHTKLAEIMAKAGLKNIGNETERCLSLCVEERLRTLIGRLIRLSKQRTDTEKEKHKIEVTSDIQSHILHINKGLKDKWEKKQAEEAEKLRKVNETESAVETEKEEARPKPQKVNKEEEDKMRTNAANVAARAAIGGDDMLSKWQLLAEQARQRREGAGDGASNARANKEVKKKPAGILKSGTNSENQEADRNGVKAGSLGNAGRNLGLLSQTRSTRVVTVKDLIACLECEPQMTKSTILYRLYMKEALQNKDK
eukprot:TRINITY_DN1568_c0_g2_i1.p1 TRINITY_DN1568_c0_g2~~TRINITY_DN1568_c0_g2_i1.p1  ORF type:complete len:1092 (-),score=296.70 TRINITY_DN1568_c0_g2_i1:621-3896(-)